MVPTGQEYVWAPRGREPQVQAQQPLDKWLTLSGSSFSYYLSVNGFTFIKII